MDLQVVHRCPSNTSQEAIKEDLSLVMSSKEFSLIY